MTLQRFLSATLDSSIAQPERDAFAPQAAQSQEFEYVNNVKRLIWNGCVVRYLTFSAVFREKLVSIEDLQVALAG